MPLKIHNLYVIAAREVTTDAGDGMVSVFKIIDKFSFTYDPAQDLNEESVFPASYSVATSWYMDEFTKKETSLTFALKIQEPSGVVHDGPSQAHTVPAGIDKLNFSFNINGLPASGAGRFKLLAEVLSADGKVLAEGSYPFMVELNER